MKTTIRTIVITVAAFIFFATEVSAQKVSAAAVVDQHYAAQTSSYKLMMLALAGVYGLYVVLYVKRKKEVNRFMGRV
jgi:uncharacterized membrane protein